MKMPLLQIDRHSPVEPPRSPSVQQEPSPEGTAYQVHIETFGCQMNEYDSELVRSILQAKNFSFTHNREQADVVLMNTCAIREHAHNKVYGHLGALRATKRQRNLVVGVLGCMAQNLKKELTEKEPLIDVLVGPDSYRQLPQLLTKALQAKEQGKKSKGMATDLSEYETYADILPAPAEGINAWIAITRGCDNFCTFCVVPYTRGRERSREPEGIIREAEHLVAQGYRQITLLGQNVNSYHDKNWDFTRLITAVADVPGIERVRFTSPHPKDFPTSLLEAMAGHPKICNQLHLPLQSGNDRILKLMSRTYTNREYRSLVEKIRRIVPQVEITTDIICGFCTETDQDFQDTMVLIRDIEYLGAFVFKYSERKNTIAERKYPDDVPDLVKTERVSQLVDLQRAITARKNQQLVGQTLSILVEGDSRKSEEHWMGKTESSVTVVCPKENPLTQPGTLVPVTITEASAATLLGCEAPALSEPYTPNTSTQINKT